MFGSDGFALDGVLRGSIVTAMVLDFVCLYTSFS